MNVLVRCISNTLKCIPRLFPNLVIIFRKDIRDILPLRYSWIKKEIVAFAVVIGIVIIIELYEDISYYGKIEYIKESILLLNVFIYFILLFLFLWRKRPDEENNHDYKWWLNSMRS